MKKLLFHTLLLSVCVLNSVMAQSSLEALKNPYRGFRHEIFILIEADGAIVNAYNRNQTINIQSKINEIKNVFGTNDEHVRLSQLYIYLTDFTGGNISQAALISIEGVLTTLKNNNLQVLLRWVYDYDGDPNSSNTGVSNVTFADITNHLNQLTSIVTNNDGAICNMNGGILGLWGEWHNRSLSLLADASGLDNMFSEVLEDHLPSYMQTQVRVPRYKTERNLSQNLKDRIGFHNDFFTAGEHARAPGNDYVPGDSWYETVKAQSPYVIVDGEMPYEGASEWHIDFAIDIYKTLKIFKEHHYNSFSLVHSFNLNIGAWKNVILDKAKMISESEGIRYHPEYFKENDIVVDRSMYEFVRDHLGYRLYVDATASTVAQNGQSLAYSVAIENYGFSRPYTNNSIKMVVLDTDNNIVAIVDNDTDMLDWQPIDPLGDQLVTLQHTISGTIDLEDTLESDIYKIGFYMPSKSVGFESNTEYAIKLANRYSDIEKISISGKEIFVFKSIFYDSSLTGTEPYCTVSSNGVAQDRYIENIKTTNAFGNINSTSDFVPVDSYFKYSKGVLQINKENSFDLSLTNSPNTKFSKVYAWMDWNGDGDFYDSNELLFQLGSSKTDNSATVLNIDEEILVPSSAVEGVSRMRIRFHDAALDNSSSCGAADNTTTFDIYVKILPVNVSLNCTANNALYGSETNTRKDYFIKSLSTSGGTQNISYTNGVYPTTLGDGHGEDLTSYVEVLPGSDFTLIMENNVPGSGELHARMKAWIDYNDDGDFDDSDEEILSIGQVGQDNASVLQHVSQLISVPGTAALGSKRIRVRMRDSWVGLPTACGDNTIATTFDFKINIVSVLGLNKPQEKNKYSVQIYPTITSGYVYFKSRSNEISEANVAVFDFSGRMIKSKKIRITNDIHGAFINLVDLKESIYIVRIQYANQVIVQKILVKKE